MKKDIAIFVGGLAVILTLFVAGSAPSCEAAEKIVLAGSMDTKGSFHGRWLALIYTEVFRRLGYELQYNGYPSARASWMSDAGRVDGEINRVSDYHRTHPNMIRVDEPHFSTILSAYAVRPGIVIDGWESLKHSAYRVEYRRGTKILEIGLRSAVRPEKLSDITSTLQGVKRLILGRTDLYVDVQDLVNERLLEMDRTRFDTSKVYEAGVLAEDTLHLFLHRKNAALVPKIDAALKAMKAAGLIAHYKTAAMRRQSNPI